MTKFVKTILISVFLSLVFYVIMYLYKDTIDALIERILKSNKQGQLKPTESFITAFGSCSPFDIDLDMPIDLNREYRNSCEIAYLQTRLNATKNGGNIFLVINGNLDDATKNELFSQIGTGVFSSSFSSIQSLEDWLKLTV